MIQEPQIKRTIAFIDGQNLFHSVKESFGYYYPNYDPLALSQEICNIKDWKLTKVIFYTGIPSKIDNPFWNSFWIRKLSFMGRKGVEVFKRDLKYHNEVFVLPDGSNVSKLVGHEKGIDVRIALDIIRYAYEDACDVVLVFSQDQDLSEVAQEIRYISNKADRWIKIACSFPLSPTTINKRGINGTDWIPIAKPLYDKCIDHNDYRDGSSI